MTRSRRGVRTFTLLQGQYLSFIHFYTKLNSRPPAETDMQAYFKVAPPSVHDTVLRLEERGLIARTPGAARSVKLLVPADELPALE
jgi:Mn-dependent DtxR family transcriptional regulator